MKTYKIAAVNLGSGSTKIAYYENDNCVFIETIKHPSGELAAFPTVWAQSNYRREAILTFLEGRGIRLEELDAIVSMGGLTEPVLGGVYRITPKMVQQCESDKYGTHALNLGIQFAYEAGKSGPLPLIVNSPCTDELQPLARYSGLPELPRVSRLHTLNQKAVANLYAEEHGLVYEQLNLIVVHMGGGITAAAHRKGKMVDAPNGVDGDGPFSTDRCCTVPVGALVDLCYSGQYTREQMYRRINGNGGLKAYLGESDTYLLERRALAGDLRCREALEAMCYQVAKEIGGLAAVLSGEVDAILITGGMANSKFLIDQVSGYVRFIAPVHVYPGEQEMQSLCLNAYRALLGEAEIQEM